MTPVTFCVVQPIVSRTDPTWQTTATVISRHRTREAAERKIADSTRRMQSHFGHETSWLDWHVIEIGHEPSPTGWEEG